MTPITALAAQYPSAITTGRARAGTPSDASCPGHHHSNRHRAPHARSRRPSNAARPRTPTLARPRSGAHEQLRYCADAQLLIARDAEGRS
jgi:hypothetical protein